jgi:hypothetical protein
MTCTICRASDHDRDGHYDEAFTNPVTREPYPVPDDIRRAAEHICRVYPIRGICDPMYVANTIARETGRGDGKSNFWEAECTSTSPPTTETKS